MTDFLWKAPGNEATLCGTGDTDLDSLADDDFANITNGLDNSTNRHTHAVFELKMGSAVDISAGNDEPVCFLYAYPSYDGTNYVDDADLTNERSSEEYRIAALAFQKQAGQTYAVAENIPIGPIKYKFAIFNQTGVALAADNNTLKVKTYCLTDS